MFQISCIYNGSGEIWSRRFRAHLKIGLLNWSEGKVPNHLAFLMNFMSILKVLTHLSASSHPSLSHVSAMLQPSFSHPLAISQPSLSHPSAITQPSLAIFLTSQPTLGSIHAALLSWVEKKSELGTRSLFPGSLSALRSFHFHGSLSL